MNGAANTFHSELLDLPDQLAGDRVLLRPYRAGDGKAFFEAIDRHRAELRTWLGWIDQQQTPEDAEAYARRMQSRWIARSSLIFGIWLRENNEYLGGTGFHGFDWAAPSFELGYFLHPDARGKGYATEAVKLVIGFGFDALAAHRIWASCDARNLASVRVLERCGLTREGLLHNERRDHHGMLRDTALYAITRSVQ